MAPQTGTTAKRAAAALIGVGLAAGAYVAFAPAGAGGDKQDVGNSFQRSDQVIDQLDAAIDGFDGAMPPGDQARIESAERALADAEGELFEKGFAESMVVDIWRCGWEDTYLKALASGDQEGANAALGHLETFYDLNYTKIYFEDPDRAWAKTVLQPALKGDARALEADLANCQDGNR